MPMSRKQKEQQVVDLTDKLNRAKSLVFAYYRGLRVKEVEDLRKQCRKENIDYLVAKKTLLSRVFKQQGMEGVDVSQFTKPVATIFSFDDEVAPARIVAQFAKEHEALEVAGGMLEQQFVGSDKVMALSKLPSKLELLAKVAGSLQAPVSGFVRVLAGVPKSFLYALQAIKETK